MGNYEKLNFTSGQVLKAEHLNHMEEGIASASPISIYFRYKSGAITCNQSFDFIMNKISDYNAAQIELNYPDSDGASILYRSTAWKILELVYSLDWTTIISYKIRFDFGNDVAPIIVDCINKTIEFDSSWHSAELPNTDSSHQYLTTNGSGEVVWEDKLCYEWQEEAYLLKDFKTATRSTPLGVIFTQEIPVETPIYLEVDGIAYECYQTEGGLFGVFIGNGPLLQGEGGNTDCPFVIGNFIPNQSAILYQANPEEHIVSVYTTVPKVASIPGKYIAGGISEGTALLAQAFNGSSPERASGIQSASFNGSTAEGYASMAINSSKVEGLAATFAFSQGEASCASGRAAVAQNCFCQAKGRASHAEGFNTIASGQSQHTEGTYNIEDTENKYIHIAGNGEYEARSNAHTVDWTGNGWFSGDVYVGSTSGTNKDEGSKKLATEDFVRALIEEKLAQLTNAEEVSY